MNNAKIEMVKSVISQIVGIAVDFTVRGQKSFTFHFEGQNEKAMQRIAKYFGNTAEIELDYDLECDYSCVFVEVR